MKILCLSPKRITGTFFGVEIVWACTWPITTTYCRISKRVYLNSFIFLHGAHRDNFTLHYFNLLPGPMQFTRQI